MLRHSCDAWVEKRKAHCPICGWRADLPEVEPLPTLVKPVISLPTPRRNQLRKKKVLPPVYAEKPGPESRKVMLRAGQLARPREFINLSLRLLKRQWPQHPA